MKTAPAPLARLAMRRLRAMSLRTYLTATVVTLVALPLVLFWAWPYSRALQNEIEEVHDRHLLIARNLGAALQRYHRDARATFDFTADALLAAAQLAPTQQLLANLRFKSVCLLEADSGRVLAGLDGLAQCPEVSANIRYFRDLSVAGKTVVSGVHAGASGEPLVCLVRRAGDRLVIGAIDTAYFVELAKAVSFGERGHAVIVDQTGRVLAHPLAGWGREMRDLSQLDPVRRMLTGGHGVATFHSPALRADMIAGFTAVPGPGWGVMVAQPMSELTEVAGRIQLSALLIFGAGLAVAALVACWMAWLLVRPLNSVITAARSMAGGAGDVRIERSSRFVPSEIRTLTASFNVMARRVARFNKLLERRVAERTATATQALQDARLANERLVAEVRERGRVEAELRASNEALLAATRSRSQFLATMSHEIRTPMNGVIGTLRLLMKSPLDEHQQLCARSAQRSAESLLVILNDILDHSKLEAGRLALEHVSFNLADLLDDITGLFRPAATAKSLDIALRLEPGEAQWLTGDPTRIRQVLLNLVGNAIKFTPAGGVILAATCAPSRGSLQRVRIEVSDTGIGIAQAALDDLFTPFTQGDGSATRPFGGTGLGLAISKQLVERMGGRIGAVSNVGAGSMFWVELELPRGTPTLAQPGDVAARSSAPGTRQLRILLAEDNPVNQLVAEQVLRDAGHAVDTVANGRDAVAAATQRPYDLVLMDIQMPEMDGTMATRLIRQSDAPTRALPIIALTANACGEDRAAYTAAGIDAVVAKPFADEALLSTIAGVLAARRAAGAGCSQRGGARARRAVA